MTFSPKRLALVALAAPLFSLGLLAPAASAAPAAPASPVARAVAPMAPSPFCGFSGNTAGAAFYCDFNDVATLVSDLLTPALQTTCVDTAAGVVVCRIEG
jgi:hypothetical protein